MPRSDSIIAWWTASWPSSSCAACASCSSSPSCCGSMRDAIGASRLTVRTLGLVPYREALRIQEQQVLARAESLAPDTLLLLEHPPVLTAGRGTGDGSVRADAEALQRRGLEVVPVSRGGDVTWHGPGQLVGYPI